MKTALAAVLSDPLTWDEGAFLERELGYEVCLYLPKYKNAEVDYILLLTM